MSTLRTDTIRTLTNSGDVPVENIQLVAEAYKDGGLYAVNVVINDYHTYIDKDGIKYRLVAGTTVPYTTTGVWAVESVNFAIIGDDTLRAELANGGPYLVDAAVVGVGNRTLAEVAGDELNLLSYENLSVNGTRWDIALQTAVDEVLATALANNSNFGLKRIVIPAGTYVMGGTVTSYPFVKIQPKGTVLLDWSASPVTTNGIWINNHTNILYDITIPHAHGSPCLGGAEGTISIKGQGRDGVSLADGIQVGNSVGGFSPCRDVHLLNVNVVGWSRGLKFFNYDTYMFRADKCTISTNDTNVAFPDYAGVLVNSGERMVFDGCTFGASNYAISHAGQRWDCYWIGCSFDFHGSVIRLWSTATFAQHKFTSCYFEGWDNYLVDAATPGTQCSLTFQAPTFLASKWRDNTLVSSPSRLLFNCASTVAVSVSDSWTITTTRPYLEDSYVATSTTNVLRYTGTAPSSYSTVPFASNIVNRDYDFQIDASGTQGNVLTAWERIAGFSNVTTNEIATVGGRKVLQLTGTSDTLSAISFRSKDNIAAKPGDRFICNMSLQAPATTGILTTQAGVEFFDASGASLGTFPSFRQYGFKDALDDATVPNYASGTSRFMDTSAFVAVAPKNTAYGRMRFTMSSFNGTVYISRVRMWKD